QFLPLVRRQALLPPAFISIGLHDPIPDRLRRRFELSRQLLRRPPLANERHQLLLELFWVCLMGSWHRGSPQCSGVHETGSTPLEQGASHCSHKAFIRCKTLVHTEACRHSTALPDIRKPAADYSAPKPINPGAGRPRRCKRQKQPTTIS